MSQNGQTHCKNLAANTAANVARFLMRVRQFGTLFIIIKVSNFQVRDYVCCIEIIFKKLFSYLKEKNGCFKRRISVFRLCSVDIKLSK